MRRLTGHRPSPGILPAARGGAVITGAGGGLGRQIALRLARAGFTLQITDVDRRRAEAVTAEINAEFPRPVERLAFASSLDVRDADACSEAAEATRARSGSLALWVNNAGALFTGPVWEQDERQRRLVLEVNAAGTINGTLAALKIMRPADAGQVVNVASLAGLVGVPGEGIYAASKHAVLGFSVSALADLRAAGVKGVEISCVCPDGLWTPMLHDKLDDPGAALSFTGKLLDPGEVADLVLRVIDKPRPVTAWPRWRGGQVRVFDAWPGLAVRLAPLMVAYGRRRQGAFARKLKI
ncbi:MAG: SDR family NAD(P)-dependent oxidoreductase [Arthrobacter sp.]|nr:SDR family oxidoreductase [Micrococcaceae bacterium]MDN5813592.1 SDR family oxidoreductase [Micrococcaceae bacterium]MDN5906615.1 SDR family oxidoreductase [Micrococcaceae bacterium]MDN6332634.1 SDR family oxidoreductase [Micrococcaceae bacterium]